jgi:ribosome recycling factor
MVSHSLWNIEEKMQASIEVLKRELASIRTGHATPTLIEHIKIEYAGVPTPLHLEPVSSSSNLGPKVASII